MKAKTNIEETLQRARRAAERATIALQNAEIEHDDHGDPTSHIRRAETRLLECREALAFMKCELEWLLAEAEAEETADEQRKTQ